jgi:hypothetical protein
MRLTVKDKDMGEAMKKTTVLAAAAAAAAVLIAGCGSGHDAQYKNGYNYAFHNSGQASQDMVPGVFNQNDWCAVGEKYAAYDGPIGGDWMSGCLAGLQDAGVTATG